MIWSGWTRRADVGADETRVPRASSVIVVASPRPGAADEIVRSLRQEGKTAYAAHSLEGCLRLATTLGPDLILIDPILPRRLETLLRAHPKTARSVTRRLNPVAAPMRMSPTPAPRPTPSRLPLVA